MFKSFFNCREVVWGSDDDPDSSCDTWRELRAREREGLVQRQAAERGGEEGGVRGHQQPADQPVQVSRRWWFMNSLIIF